MTGMYGRAFLESLKDSKPAKYAAMTPAEREEIAAEIQETSQDRHDSILRALLKQHPMPKDAIARIQHLTNLDAMAREVVMQDVIVPDEEWQEAMKNGRQGYLEPDSGPATG